MCVCPMVNMHRPGKHAEIPPVTITQTHTHTHADVSLRDGSVVVSSRTTALCIWELLKWICSSWLKSCCSSLHNTHLTDTAGDLLYSRCASLYVCVWSHCITSVSLQTVQIFTVYLLPCVCVCVIVFRWGDLINDWSDWIISAECFGVQISARPSIFL